MPRRPRRPRRTLFARTVALVRRNPWKVIIGAVTLFGGVPSAVAGVVYIRDNSEPWWVAQRYWVRDYSVGALAPVTKVQSDHDFAINYLILKELKASKKDAETDRKNNPNSTTIPQNIERLDKAIQRQEDKLSKTPITGPAK